MPGTPVPYCTACKNVAVLCKCEDPGQEVSFAWDQPDEVTPDSKLARWLVMVQLHPRLKTLDPANFLDQYKKQGLLEAFERLKPRLAAMAEEYDLRGPDGQPLIDVFQCFSSQGYTEHQLRRDVVEGMAAFVNLDWTVLTNFGLSMVNNAFQSGCTLHPERYPRSHPDLKMAQEVLNVLITVNQLASERIEYSLECMLVLEADKVDSIGEAAGAAAARAGGAWSGRGSQAAGAAVAGSSGGRQRW